MRRCEDEKMRYRPPLLEEPCAQTLSGKNWKESGGSRVKSQLATMDHICFFTQNVLVSYSLPRLRGSHPPVPLMASPWPSIVADAKLLVTYH